MPQLTVSLLAPDKFETHINYDTVMLSRKGDQVVCISMEQKII
jgi:hypothetical protein